jgi:hypothetical protein
MSTPAALSAWLRARTPAPPPELASRIESMIAAGLGSEVGSELRSDSNCGQVASDSNGIGEPQFESDPNSLIASATTAMATLLHDGCLTRQSALDLLAIDALVTYAFEAAADDPDGLDARAEGALASIAALAEPYHA